MIVLTFILQSVVNILIFSPSPNLFGSRKRRKAKEKIAGEYKDMAKETAAEIDLLKSENPFESAAAKSAMTQSARNAKQVGQRYANLMGANANPESLIAAQSATQSALAGTAGDIATGAEANQAAQIAQLRGEKSQMMNQSLQTKQAAADEYGSGWNTFFEGLTAVGSLTSGAGQAAAALK